MKKTPIDNAQSGFTIIEVLIVLAIAGLVMLIVFLAVPALQRNSRNTQRRRDVGDFLAAANEWSTKNQGKIPTTSQQLGEVAAEISFTAYDPPTIAVNGASSQAAVTDPDALRYVYAAGCDAAGATIQGSTKAFVVQYAIETSATSVAPQCQGS